MKAYYAHCMLIYHTKQEEEDIALLKSLGFDVENPNIDKNYKKPMDFFVELACSCDLIAFRALSDGSISAGVAKEINEAKKRGIPIIELPNLDSRKELTIAETRTMLRKTSRDRNKN